jgi:hypothetical protein
MLEGRRFESRMRWIFFNLPNPSSRIMALGSTQPLTEMSTRNLPGDKKRPARRAGNFAAIYEPIVTQNMGASTTRNPKGLHGLYRDSFTLLRLFDSGQEKIQILEVPILEW